MAPIDLLITFALSAAPISELRGGIPYALAREVPPAVAYVVAVLGNLAVVPVLLLGLEGISRRLKQLPRVERILSRIAGPRTRKHRIVRRWGPAALVLLVAIPLPGTGAWTASLVAHVLGLPRRLSIPMIAAGVLIAGVLVLLAGLGVIRLVGGSR